MILAEGYQPAFGARPLRRYIEKNVVSAISRMLLAGELVEHSTVNVTADASQKQLLYAAVLNDRKRAAESGKK